MGIASVQLLHAHGPVLRVGSFMPAVWTDVTPTMAQLK